MPNKDKFSMFLPDGVWEDSLGNYGKGYCYGIIESSIKKDDFFQYLQDSWTKEVQKAQKIKYFLSVLNFSK